MRLFALERIERCLPISSLVLYACLRSHMQNILVCVILIIQSRYTLNANTEHAIAMSPIGLHTQSPYRLYGGNSQSSLVRLESSLSHLMCLIYVN